MPKDSRARTRAARALQAASGGTYTQALAAAAVPAMNRDTAGAVTAALGFGELMAAGARAARATAGEGLPAAIAAVREAVIPLWPQTVPEAARDVLIACADLAVTRHQVFNIDPALDPSVIVRTMLDFTAARAAGTQPDRAGGFPPPQAFASSVAFDRDDDAAVLKAVCVLLAIAHPASAGRPRGGPGRGAGRARPAPARDRAAHAGTPRRQAAPAEPERGGRHHGHDDNGIRAAHGRRGQGQGVPYGLSGRGRGGGPGSGHPAVVAGHPGRGRGRAVRVHRHDRQPGQACGHPGRLG